MADAQAIYNYNMGAILTQKATYNLQAGSYAEAYKSASEALALVESTEGISSDLYGACLWIKGLCLIHQPNQEQAGERMIKEAMVLFEKNPMDNTLYFQLQMIIGADIFSKFKRLDLVEACFRQMMAYTKKKHGAKSGEYAEALAMAGSSFMKNKLNASEGFTLLMQADSIATKNNDQPVKTFCALIKEQVYEKEGDYASAKAILLGILNAPKTKAKPRMGLIASTLNNKLIMASAAQNLGVLFTKEENWAEAENYYKQGLSYRLRIKPKGFMFAMPMTLPGLKNNLAYCYAKQKKYKEAEIMYAKALHEAAKAPFANVGAAGNSWVEINTNFAVMYYDWGKPEKGARRLAGSVGYIYSKYAKYCTYRGPDELKEINTDLRFYLDAYYAYNEAAHYFPEEAKSDLYTLELHLKGVALRNIQEVQKAIDASNNIELQQRYYSWIALQKELGIIAKQDGKYNKEQQKKFKTEKELYRSLCEDSAPFNKMNIFWQTTYKNIQEVLLKNEAAIEFVSYHSIKDHKTHLAALLLTADKAPQYIALGTAEHLKTLLAGEKNGDAIRIYINNLYSKGKGDSLYAQLIAPLEPYLKGMKTVWVSRTTGLHGLALEALPMPNSDTLRVGDNRAWHYVSSTRVLAEEVLTGGGFRARLLEKPHTALLVGEIDFDTPNIATVSAVDNGRMSAAPRVNSISSEKIDSVAKRFTTAKITKLMGGAATEKAIGEAFAGKELVYFSTHGMYAEAKDTAGDRPHFDALCREADAMRRTFITVAGYNTVFNSENEVENVENDGALTAYELAQLDLHSCKLAVLAACETGLGDENSEGVWGLQRGLKQAGAQSLLLSYYTVPATETALLMTAFYGYYLSETAPLSAAVALQKAKAVLRKQYPTRAFLWAGFYVLD
jgi:CHAT domain-containing protein/tetratricopeptide (TPR) repeat protein